MYICRTTVIDIKKCRLSQIIKANHSDCGYKKGSKFFSKVFKFDFPKASISIPSFIFPQIDQNVWVSNRVGNESVFSTITKLRNFVGPKIKFYEIVPPPFPFPRKPPNSVCFRIVFSLAKILVIFIYFCKKKAKKIFAKMRKRKFSSQSKSQIISNFVV